MKENTSIKMCVERDGEVCGICKEPISKEIAQYIKYLEFAKDIKNQKRQLQRKLMDFRKSHVSINIDHIIPRSKGGENRLENYQVAHMMCNSIKSDKYEADQDQA